MVKNEKERILDALKNEQVGMTIQDVTRKTGMNRITATIYLHELLGEKKVTIRKIGAYKLFRLKSK